MESLPSIVGIEFAQGALMTHGSFVRPALAAAFTLSLGIALIVGTASAAGINGINNGMPNRLSMNRCMDPSGKPVTDPAACASGGCIDASGKPVTDAASCAASPPATGPTGATGPTDPSAVEGGKITKSRSNIQNN